MTDEHGRVPGPLQSGPVLIGVFGVLALVAAVGTVLILGGSVDQLVWALVYGVLATTVILGTYLYGRRAGQPYSHALAVSVVTFGALLLVAIVAELLYSSGELSNMEIGMGLGGTVLVALVVVGLTAVLDRATAA